MSTAKSDIIKKLANSYPNFIQRDLKRLINITLYEMSSALARGERVEIRDSIGTFETRISKSKFVRNPRTGAKFFSTQKVSIAFKMSKELQKRINEDKVIN